MDRAHRIGQKKVVNVYRLITKGTLEEKIMRWMCVCGGGEEGGCMYQGQLGYLPPPPR